MRCWQVITILLLFCECFNQVRIFDFFAYFVRSMTEIVKDSAQIGTMLAYIVLAQTILFWLLDAVDSNSSYTGWRGLL